MKKLLYSQVLAGVKEKILNGQYEIGSMIPTELELESEYEVSKVTVRRAIEILVQEGYLVKKSGKGTRVLSNRVFNKLSKAVSFTSILEEEGYNVKKEIVNVSIIEEKSVANEVLRVQGKLICLERIYLLNEEPYALFKHFVPYSDNYEILKDSKSSLYSWLQSNGHEIKDISDKMSVCISDKRIKSNLGNDVSEVLKRERHSYNEEDQCIEYSVAHYDTKKRPYEIKYKV